jgi:hypothetical protein
MHYFVFENSIALSALAAVVAAVAYSAASFDFRTVSFRFASVQNSFVPVAAAVAFAVVASFHFGGVQTHHDSAVVAVQYFFALVAGEVHFACLFPGYVDSHFDVVQCSFVPVADVGPAGHVSSAFACV